MPVLLHMGVIGGGLDYSITHPRRDAAAAQAYQRKMAMQVRLPARNVSASRMSPLHLDTIANRFPRLNIIGAHLGNRATMKTRLRSLAGDITSASICPAARQSSAMPSSAT